MTLLARRLLPAVLTLVLLAAACGGSRPGEETRRDGGGADTADPALDAADTHDRAGDDSGVSDHHGAPPTVDGTPVETTMTPGVPEDDATTHGHEHGTGASAGHEHSHGEGGGHATAGAPTRYDADVADAVQTITIDVVDGGPVGGVQRVAVEHGSVVALMVTSGVAEEVHVHGYDILRAVSDGRPAHFAFTAEIPGVFEVEFEGSGRLLMQLEIS